MKFVQNFLHPRHLVRSPHKWLLAALLSPVHAGEMRYKTHYHLRYNHARKLFLFDILLLLFATVLCAATLWWYWYDPTVTANVHVQIEGPDYRITSGNNVTVYVQYENNSEVSLTDVSLSITLPTHTTLLEPKNTSLSLPNLDPGDQGNVPIMFEYLTSPDAHDNIIAKLSYTQAGEQVQELVVARRTLVASESTLTIQIKSPPAQIAANSRFPITMQLTNMGDNKRLVRVHNDVAPGVTFLSESTADILLEPGESQDISGTLVIENIPRNPIVLLFSPAVIIDNDVVRQHGEKINAQVIAPALRVTNDWADNINALAPGQSGNFLVTITNIGDTPLSNLRVSIPLLGARVSRSVLRDFGNIANDTLTVNGNYNAALFSLAPGASHTLNIPIQILSDTNANAQNSLQLFSRVSASVTNTGITVTDTSESPAIQLGGSLNAYTQSWYYTPEGDQLGRGPLPPRIDEETKYWVSVSAQNGSSNLSDVRIQGSLAPGVRFTGKTSVTAGSNITYDETLRTWIYTLGQLPAGAGLGIHMELAITPSEADVGTHLPLVTDVLLKANDNYINVPITTSLPDVTTALVGDKHAAARGTRVIH